MNANLGRLSTLWILLGAGAAHAHIEVKSGPAIANKTQEIIFAVGHGCTGADTYKVKLDIAAGVTAVRPLRSDFGKVAVEKDATGAAVTAVVWQKSPADALEADISYYKLTLQMKVPDKPFTRLYFPIHQTCRAADGTLSTVDWVALPGQAGEPAAALTIVPSHLPGWNKFSNSEHISDISVFFSDSQIVWKGTAAWSPNANTMDLIKTSPGVTVLSDGLHPDDEIWVKY